VDLPSNLPFPPGCMAVLSVVLVVLAGVVALLR
jgi:hypothetical protein